MSDLPTFKKFGKKEDADREINRIAQLPFDEISKLDKVPFTFVKGYEGSDQRFTQQDINTSGFVLQATKPNRLLYRGFGKPREGEEPKKLNADEIFKNGLYPSVWSKKPEVKTKMANPSAHIQPLDYPDKSKTENQKQNSIFLSFSTDLETANYYRYSNDHELYTKDPKKFFKNAGYLVIVNPKKSFDARIGYFDHEKEHLVTHIKPEEIIAISDGKKNGSLIINPLYKKNKDAVDVISSFEPKLKYNPRREPTDNLTSNPPPKAVAAQAAAASAPSAPPPTAPQSQDD
jgi:hypothetical protein